MKNFWGFEGVVEKLAVKHYSQNIKKGREIIDHYIEILSKEGITYIEPFTDGNKDSVVPAIKLNKESNKENHNENNGTTTPIENNVVNENNLVTHGPLSSKSNFPSRDVNLKLESEYIARCVGKMTPFQESCLVQLKKWIGDAHQGKVPSDQTMMRFLKAQDFDLERAREMLCQSLVWRKKYQVDRILSNYDIPQVVKEYFPGGWHHYDKESRPLYILRLGQMDVKGFIKSIGQEGLIKLVS